MSVAEFVARRVARSELLLYGFPTASLPTRVECKVEFGQRGPCPRLRRWPTAIGDHREFFGAVYALSVKALFEGRTFKGFAQFPDLVRASQFGEKRSQ